MDVAALKLDLIQWLAQIQDESLLKKIQLIRDSKEEKNKGNKGNSFFDDID